MAGSGIHLSTVDADLEISDGNLAAADVVLVTLDVDWASTIAWLILTDGIKVITTVDFITDDCSLRVVEYDSISIF